MHLDTARHGICLPDGVWQGIFLLDAAVLGHFPSGHSRVRAFFFWTQPYQGIFLLDAAVSGHFLLDASRRHVSWHQGHAGYQGTQHRSKYSRRIRKHALGSTHSDSIQFYSLHLMYIYIYYYHTSPSQCKNPVSCPSRQSSSNTVLMCVALLCVLETKESWRIRHDTMSTMQGAR